MPSDKDNFRRALGRLRSVPPEVLRLSRQRIRGNLNADFRLGAPLPLPDATPADLSVLRRPFYVAGVTALLCLLIGGAVLVERTEKRSASRLVAKSSSMQASKSPAPVPASRSGTALPYSETPELPKANKITPSSIKGQRRSAVPPPIEARPPQQRLTPLPPGEGRAILDRACDGCHRAASVGFYHYATRAEYAEVVSRMIAMGAQISEQDAPVLTDYLFNNLAAKNAVEIARPSPQ